jgi:hypothetical protein
MNRTWGNDTQNVAPWLIFGQVGLLVLVCALPKTHAQSDDPINSPVVVLVQVEAGV